VCRVVICVVIVVHAGQDCGDSRASEHSRASGYNRASVGQRGDGRASVGQVVMVTRVKGWRNACNKQSTHEEYDW
jgi:hypothetical protein